MTLRRPTVPLPLLALATLACAGLAPLAQAEVKPTPAAIDFGNQRQERVLKAAITLTNTGAKPVEIVRVGADCSCTAATSRLGNLAPGESTTVDVSFETRSYQGEVVRRVFVQTSEGDLLVPVRALVSAFDDWTFSQQGAVFAASNKGAEAKTSLLVRYLGKGEARVTGVRADVPWISAATEETPEGTRIVLTKRAEAPAGNHQPAIHVSTTDAHEPEISFPAYVSVYSNLNIKPNPVLLPMTPVGKSVAIPLTLSGWEAREDPRFELEDGEAKVSQRDGGEVLASVSVTPRRAGSATRLLRIYAGDSLEAEVPVIVRAE